MRKLFIIFLTCMTLVACANSTSGTSKVTNASTIVFSETTTISGGGLTLEDDVVTITSPGAYEISGSSETGRIIVDTDTTGTVHLILKDVSLTSNDGPVLTVTNADSTIIEVPENTTSTITVSGQNEDEKDSAIYAKDDLTITGSGTLVITSSDGDAIHANDSLIVEDVTLDITSGDDGIDVNDDISITNANISILAGGGYENGTSKQDDFSQMPNMNDRPQDDGNRPEGFEPNQEEGERPQDFDPSLQGDTSEDMTQKEPPQHDGDFNPQGKEESPKQNEESAEEDSDTPKAKGIKNGLNLNITDSTLSINSSDDAINSEGDIVISNSTLTISAGDDGIHSDASLTIDSDITIEHSYEGLEALNLTINSGNISVTSSDDGINTVDASATNDMQADSSFLTINGGNITVYAEGDGVDMNGNGEMNNGLLLVYGPQNGGNGALDFNGTFNVNGGMVLAGGASGMAVMPSETSAVNILMIDATGDIEIKDSDGNVCFSYSSEKSYQNLVIASSDLELNKEYTIYEDGEIRETITLTEHVTNLSSKSEDKGPGQNPMPQKP